MTPPPPISAVPSELILMPSARDFRAHVKFDPSEFRPSRRKKVLFVVPPGTLEMNYGRLSAAGAELPWLGMGYVAGATRAAGHEVYLVDYEVTGRGYADLAA